MCRSPFWAPPEHETLSERSHRIARAQARYDQIQVDYPPQTEVIAVLDEVRLAARLRPPGSPCGGAMVVAPHGTGKTVAVKQLMSHAALAASEGQIPVLSVEIATQETSDSVPSSILHALRRSRTLRCEQSSAITSSFRARTMQSALCNSRYVLASQGKPW